jgi:hypothetical protein
MWLKYSLPWRKILMNETTLLPGLCNEVSQQEKENYASMNTNKNTTFFHKKPTNNKNILENFII